MIDDYKKWFEKNSDFLNKLYRQGSILYDRIEDVVALMNVLCDERWASLLFNKDIDQFEDVEKLFELGYNFLYERVNEIQYYLKYNFNDDIKELKKYESLINYTFYIDELLEALEDRKELYDKVSKELKPIQEKLDTIITNKENYNIDILDEYNLIISSVVPDDTELYTIVDIFQSSYAYIEDMIK